MPKIWKNLSSTLASLSSILPNCKNIITFTAKKQMSKKNLLLGTLLLNQPRYYVQRTKEKVKNQKGLPVTSK